MLFNPLQAKEEVDNVVSAIVLVVAAGAVYEAVAKLNFKPLAELSGIFIQSLWD